MGAKLTNRRQKNEKIIEKSLFVSNNNGTRILLIRYHLVRYKYSKLSEFIARLFEFYRVTWLADEIHEDILLQQRDSNLCSHLGDGECAFVVYLNSIYDQIGDDCHPKMSPHGILIM